MSSPPPSGLGLPAIARAIFVALHLVAVTAMALPSVGGGMNRAAWKNPTVHDEFRLWTERLNGVGIPWTQSELEDGLWELAVGYERGRDTVLRPFRPYYRMFGTWQSWRMFVAPHRYPGRLEIEVDRGDGWEHVYVARSGEHAWMRSWLDHDRTRGAVFRYSWKHYRNPRRQFADWVSVQAAATFVDAHRLRVSFMRYKTPSPEDVRAGREPEATRVLIEERDLRVVRRDSESAL